MIQKLLKNLIKIVVFSPIIVWIFWSFCNGQLSTPNWTSDISATNPYVKDKDNHDCDPSDLACFMSKDYAPTDWESPSLLNDILSVFKLDSETYQWVPKFISYVKFIVNLWLGLLSFVTLVMLIYTFYMIFFSKRDEAIKKAIWNLKWIFVALAIMWLSWLIVSFIFWRYKENWQNDTTYTAHLIENNTKIINITNMKNQNQFYLSV